jgi:hypothetical protein
MYGRVVRNLVASATHLVAEQRGASFPHYDVICTFPLKSYLGRGYEDYVDSANSRETEILCFYWIKCAIRDKIFDSCTRGNISLARRFAR